VLVKVLLTAAVLLAAYTPSVEEIRKLITAGRYDSALSAIESLPDSSEEKKPGDRQRIELMKLKARCLFELGDYPACEKELRRLLAAAGPGQPDHVECLLHLAQALTFQDLHDEALKVLDRALRLHDAPALHRQAIAVLLRAGRFDEILPHAESLLKVDSSDPFAHFVRGIALSKGGRFKEALRELSFGFKIPEAAREAHFNSALVLAKLNKPREALEHLLEIVVKDPYDQEACYQAAQQLLRVRDPAARQTARHLRSYFLALKKAQGESSREYPFAALGKAALAALMRAERWKRLSVYDRALSEIRRAQAVSRGDPEPFLYEADFWVQLGLFAEAECALARLEKAQGPLPDEVSRRVGKLRGVLAQALKRLELQSSSALGKARLKVAESPWREAKPCLESLLEKAVAARSWSLADHAARLLLARDPESVRALAFLAQRTKAPYLLVPRLHYLSRLVKLLPDDKFFKRNLAQAKRRFLGKDLTGQEVR